MKDDTAIFKILSSASAGLFLVTVFAVAAATEPCGDFGECKAIIEINATDGDIGFHFLMDGDDLNSATIHDATGAKIFEDKAKGSLTEQKLTETFAESAEPLCWEAPGEEEDWEDIVTLEDFLERWPAGTVTFAAMSDGGEKSEGETELTHWLPAAPADVDFDGSVISWGPGDDLGNCADAARLESLVPAMLPVHPKFVPVDAYEVVLEPDVDGPTGNLKFSIRMPGDSYSVSVPNDYLASLPADTPVKIEVGAIGGDDNATFTEEDGFCVNEVEGCD